MYGRKLILVARVRKVYFCLRSIGEISLFSRAVSQLPCAPGKHQKFSDLLPGSVISLCNPGDSPPQSGFAYNELTEPLYPATKGLIHGGTPPHLCS